MTRTLDGLTIGQAAKAAGVSRKAVRVYERHGMLPAAQRSAVGYRLYDCKHVELLTFIRRARLLGLHLDDIREVITIHASGETPCTAVRGMLDARIAEIDTAVAELLALRSALTEVLQHADRHQAAAPVVCAIIEDTRPNEQRVGSALPDAVDSLGRGAGHGSGSAGTSRRRR